MIPVRQILRYRPGSQIVKEESERIRVSTPRTLWFFPLQLADLFSDAKRDPRRSTGLFLDGLEQVLRREYEPLALLAYGPFTSLAGRIPVDSEGLERRIVVEVVVIEREGVHFAPGRPQHDDGHEIGFQRNRNVGR